MQGAAGGSSTVYPRFKVIAAVRDLYSLLIALPYISPDPLVFPPAEGMSGANAVPAHCIWLSEGEQSCDGTTSLLLETHATNT